MKRAKIQSAIPPNPMKLMASSGSGIAVIAVSNRTKNTGGMTTRAYVIQMRWALDMAMIVSL
jgi:hypothetical protein